MIPSSIIAKNNSKINGQKFKWYSTFIIKLLLKCFEYSFTIFIITQFKPKSNNSHLNEKTSKLFWLLYRFAWLHQFVWQIHYLSLNNFYILKFLMRFVHFLKIIVLSLLNKFLVVFNWWVILILDYFIISQNCVFA